MSHSSSSEAHLSQGRGWHPAWLVLLALAFAGAAVAIIIAFARTDKSHRLAGSPKHLGIQTSIVSLDELIEEPAKELFQGRSVSLDGVLVQEVVGDALFWIGRNAEERVPVLLLAERMDRQPEHRVDVIAGDRIAVFGVVRLMHPQRLFANAKLLSESEKQALREAPLLISALRVVKVP